MCEFESKFGALSIRRFSLFIVFFLTACSDPATYTQQTSPEVKMEDLGRKALVILASDIREETSLRKDIKHMGDVYFRRLDKSYPTRTASDYDFGIEYSLAANWAALSGKDKNRTPKIFLVDPGTYILEKVSIGSTPTTEKPGFDPASGSVRYGAFRVHEGEIINLGRLVVHMHFYEGFFSARVEDNTEEAREILSVTNANLAPRMTTRLMEAAETFPYGRR